MSALGPCEGCGRQLRTSRETLADVPNSVHRQHGHYCARCWYRVKRGIPLDIDRKEAASAGWAKRRGTAAPKTKAARRPVPAGLPPTWYDHAPEARRPKKGSRDRGAPMLDRAVPTPEEEAAARRLVARYVPAGEPRMMVEATLGLNSVHPGAPAV